MKKRFFVANHLVPDNEVWVSPKTFECSFLKDTAEALKPSHNNARDAIAFLQRAVDARIDDEWLKKVRAFLKQATAPVA
jgi:hypothetical protein